MAKETALPTTQANDMLTQLLTLLTTLGGTKTTTTTNPGDTAALQAALQQLRGADYSSMLQGVFQQAGGQIPGLQVALSNAMGARTGNNSAISAALQKLLQQTTLAGQDQLAKQQLANQTAQIQAGQAISQATKGTTETRQQGTNVAAGATAAAKAAALVQLLSSGLKLTGMGTVQDFIASLGGGTANAPAGSFNGPLQQQDAGVLFPSNVVSSAPAPQMSVAPTTGGIDIATLLAPSATPTVVAPEMTPDPAFVPFDLNTILGLVPAPAPEMTPVPDGFLEPAFDINDYLQ